MFQATWRARLGTKGKKSVSGKRPNHKITIYEVESGVLRQFIVATKASNWKQGHEKKTRISDRFCENQILPLCITRNIQRQVGRSKIFNVFYDPLWSLTLSDHIYRSLQIPLSLIPFRKCPSYCKRKIYHQQCVDNFCCKFRRPLERSIQCTTAPFVDYKNCYE